MKRPLNESGVTLPEVMISALVMAVFFASIFEVSAVCLRYISASKENIAAVECVQDRIEQLRNLDFPSLIDPTFLAVTPAVSTPQRRNLTTPANASDLAIQATDTRRGGEAQLDPVLRYEPYPDNRLERRDQFGGSHFGPGGCDLSLEVCVGRPSAVGDQLDDRGGRNKKMKILQKTRRGFTIPEMTVSAAVSSIIFAGIFAAAAGLNRSYAATDDYFSTHMQQIRIMDYLARDVKRSFSVTTTADRRTVTCVMPNYVVAVTDPEALSDSSLTGYRRTPVVVGAASKAVVDYGNAGSRALADGVTTTSSFLLTSATAVFLTTDIGSAITGAGIQAGTTIASRVSATQAVMSKAATASGSGKSFTVFGKGDRTVTDAATTANSKVLTSNTAYFTATDVGKSIVGTSIDAGSTIAAVTSPTIAVLSAVANATEASVYATIGGTVVVYALNGNRITRTENGTITTIASSTDNLLPETTDVQLMNTEYASTTVTFQPIFTMNGTAAQRSGTTAYATAYLRNKRRGN